jgi:membrane-bound serine protease (ClpP class)
VLLILGTTLAIALLDWPWRGVVIGTLAAIEVLEVLVWLKLRRRRALTGEEGLVGARGRALDDCDPAGQVRVKGAIWRARAVEPIAAGTEVEVTGVDGLTLDVRPLARDPLGFAEDRASARRGA